MGASPHVFNVVVRGGERGGWGPKELAASKDFSISLKKIMSMNMLSKSP